MIKFVNRNNEFHYYRALRLTSPSKHFIEELLINVLPKNQSIILLKSILKIS